MCSWGCSWGSQIQLFPWLFVDVLYCSAWNHCPLKNTIINCSCNCISAKAASQHSIDMSNDLHKTIFVVTEQAHAAPHLSETACWEARVIPSLDLFLLYLLSESKGDTPETILSKLGKLFSAWLVSAIHGSGGGGVQGLGTELFHIPAAGWHSNVLSSWPLIHPSNSFSM